MNRPIWIRPATFGAIAVLAMIGALAAFSFHTTARLDATFRAAGINPQTLHPWQPPAHHPG